MRMRTFLLFLFSFATLLGACSSPGTPASMAGQTPAVTRPDNLDLAATQPSHGGKFTVSYKSDLDPVTINQLHTWTLHVADSAGKPLDNAIVAIDGGMPEHNHGMPTQPIVTPLGSGDYRAEDMKFQMPGWWTVTVTVTDTVSGAVQPDSATFNLLLQ